MTKKNTIYTMEAVCHPKAPLVYPNLHILIKPVEGEENLWSGICLDLGICAYSNKNTEEEICEDIFFIITKMAVRIILHYLKKDNAKNLLHCVKNRSHDWYTFNKYNNEKKIKQLEDSYAAFKQNIESFMQNDLKAPPPDEETIQSFVNY